MSTPRDNKKKRRNIVLTEISDSDIYSSSDLIKSSDIIIPLSTRKRKRRPRVKSSRRSPISDPPRLRSRKRRRRKPLTLDDIDPTELDSTSEPPLPPKKRRRITHPKSPVALEAYETISVENFLDNPKENIPPDSAPFNLIGGWMDRTKIVSGNIIDTIFRGSITLLDMRDKIFYDMFEKFAGAAAMDLSELTRKKTEAECALMKRLDATPRMKLVYLTHKESFIPVMQTLNWHLTKNEGANSRLVERMCSLYKTRIDIEQGRVLLSAKLQKAENIRKKLGLPVEDEEEEEEEEGEMDKTMEMDEYQNLKKNISSMQNRQDDIEMSYNSSLAKFYETHFGNFSTPIELFSVKDEPEGIGNKLIGARLVSARMKIQYHVGNPVANYVADLCNVSESALIGCRRDVNAMPVIGFSAAQAIAHNVRTLSNMERERTVRIRRQEIVQRESVNDLVDYEEQMMSALSPLARTSIDRSLDALRGIMGGNDLYLIDIGRDRAILAHFADLVGLDLAERQFDRSARKPSGRYHAFRNKKDYVIKRAEIMEWFDRVSFNTNTRKFVMGHTFDGIRIPPLGERQFDTRPPYYPGETQTAGDMLLDMRRRGTLMDNARRRAKIGRVRPGGFLQYGMCPDMGG